MKLIKITVYPFNAENKSLIFIATFGYLNRATICSENCSNDEIVYWNIL